MTTYFDPNDPPPLQVTVFPTQPDALLVRTRVAQTIRIPPLLPPFDRSSVAAAFAAHDIPAHVVETTPASVQRSKRDKEAEIRVAQNAEKEAKRARLAAEADVERLKKELAKAKTELQEAHHPRGTRVNVSTSPAAITDEQKRAELVLTQSKVVAEITLLKQSLNKQSLAHADAAEKQQRLDDLRAVARALPHEIQVLKARIAVKATVAIVLPQHRSPVLQDATDAACRRFVAIAEEILGAETSDEIWGQIAHERHAADVSETERDA
jgi:hypothetical protein